MSKPWKFWLKYYWNGFLTNIHLRKEAKKVYVKPTPKIKNTINPTENWDDLTESQRLLIIAKGMEENKLNLRKT